MAKIKKITQNINKDAGILDLPKVVVPNSLWNGKYSNYLTCDIGDITPIYIDEVLPGERRPTTMGMLSHMTTPMAPIFNAQYTEFRAFFVPHRLSADLLAGYNTRKSPYVKVFGQDNAKADAKVIVPLDEQKLPDVSDMFANACAIKPMKPFGGLFDALDYEPDPGVTGVNNKMAWYKGINFLSMAAYELIYQSAYRNENRESPTASSLYRFLFNAYGRTSNVNDYDDSYHKANREKDYYTGSQPFTQKGDALSVNLLGEAPIVGSSDLHSLGSNRAKFVGDDPFSDGQHVLGLDPNGVAQKTDLTDASYVGSPDTITRTNLVADMSQLKGISIEELRILVKSQEMLEKDMLYGNSYSKWLNAHFGKHPISLELDEPLELKKVTIASEMQAIFQTSTTPNEQTILGTIGANATTRSEEFEIVPRYEFKEYGYIIICACHKAQNSYDSLYYKPKHIFKKKRFDFYVPELNDLGYQPVSGKEFAFSTNGDDPVSYNEAWAEYRYKANKVHGMFEPSRTGAYYFWTLAVSNVTDVESLYKQGVTELNRALSAESSTVPQFFDAYGFRELNDKPMSLHSIPGMDGVI